MGHPKQFGKNHSRGKKANLNAGTKIQSEISNSRTRYLLDQAINNLARNLPHYSAQVTFTPQQLIRFSVYLLIAISSLFLFPYISLSAILLCLTGFYTLVILQRGWMLITLGNTDTRSNFQLRTSDKKLPIYSVFVALYQEKEQIEELAKHLYQLNWPKDKLDIKFICEADDYETIHAIEALSLPSCFQLLIVPAANPRTKPKALNFALPLARGEFLVLYDAEDRPMPDQLKQAYDKFISSEQKLACLQAPLHIHNYNQNWLTALFAIEYYTLFNGILPVLEKWNVPLPLGGTSNHFKTKILKEVGGWDPYNVTEDADLGIRLHREGYRTGTISIPTYEEAPPRFDIWKHQRTRWIKGWMQTLLVHNRKPIGFYRDVGLKSLFVYHLVLTSVVLSALLHPILIGLFLGSIFDLVNNWQIELNMLIITVSSLNFIGGYLTYGFLALIILYRLKALNLAPLIITLPFYWLLISWAAWRALFQLFFNPHYWEKTPHGLANKTFRISIPE